MRKTAMFGALVLAIAAFGGSIRGHEHKAPHNGTLIGFGEEFAHLELVIDKTSGKISGYVLDGEAEKAVRIAQKEIEIKVAQQTKTGVAEPFSVMLKAQASALSGEKEGDTSEFAGQSDKLKGLAVFDAQVAAITIKGKAFTNVKFNFPKGNE